MSLECADDLCRGDIPQYHERVLGAGEDELAIGTECNRLNDLRVPAREGPKLLARPDVPQNESRIIRRRDDGLTVGTE